MQIQSLTCLGSDKQTIFLTNTFTLPLGFLFFSRCVALNITFLLSMMFEISAGEDVFERADTDGLLEEVLVVVVGGESAKNATQFTHSFQL